MKQEINRLFDIQLRNYIEIDKIDHLYRQTVKRVEKQVTQTKELETLRSINSEASLGNVLSFLGITLSFKSNLGSKRAASEQVVSELPPEQKIKIVVSSLLQDESFYDLNYCLDKNTVIALNSIVRFDGVAKFRMKDCKSNLSDPETKILVTGNIEDYEFKFICSRKYFIGGGSSLELDIYEQIERDLSGIASVKEIRYNSKKIFLNPVYF